jgi:serine/threonine protein kinase
MKACQLLRPTKVHRDVKPENILYRTQAEDANVVLVDFGIARHLNAEDEVGERSRSEEIGEKQAHLYLADPHKCLWLLWLCCARDSVQERARESSRSLESRCHYLYDVRLCFVGLLARTQLRTNLTFDRAGCADIRPSDQTTQQNWPPRRSGERLSFVSDNLLHGEGWGSCTSTHPPFRIRYR